MRRPDRLILALLALLIGACSLAILLALSGGGPNKADVLAATVSGVLGGGALALLFNILHLEYSRPRLSVWIEPGHKAYEAETIVFRGSASGDGKWLRLVIENKGRTMARSVTVFVTGIHLRPPRGGDVYLDWGDTLPLRWAVRQGATVIDLVPGVRYAADVMNVAEVQGAVSMEICTPEMPFRYSEELARTLTHVRSDSIHTFSFAVAAENATPLSFEADVVFGGAKSSLRWLKQIILEG